MSWLFQQLKTGSNNSTKELDLNTAARQIPFLLLFEEAFLRVLPFAIPNLFIAIFLTVFLSLITHCWSRQIHRSNNIYGIFFLIIQTVISIVLGIIYLKFGFWTSYLVHLFWDYMIIALSDFSQFLNLRKLSREFTVPNLLDFENLKICKKCQQLRTHVLDEENCVYCQEIPLELKGLSGFGYNEETDLKKSNK